MLVNNHEYGAAVRIWQRACDRAGAEVGDRAIALPVESPAAIVEAIMSKVSRADSAADGQPRDVADGDHFSTGRDLPGRSQARVAGVRRWPARRRWST